MTDLNDVFECKQCGDCCFGDGGVRLDEAEAIAVAFYLKISVGELEKLYLAKGEAPWKVRADFEGYCLFRQSDGRCLIHAVKPEVCRLWPFLGGPLRDESAFIDATAACPGLRAGLTWEDFKAAWRLEEKGGC